MTGVEVEREGERESFAADIVVLASCGAANSATLLLARQTTSTRPASPTAPIRLDVTTRSTTARRSWLSPRKRTRRASRRRSASTTSTSAGPTSSIRWETSRWSASPRPPMFRGEQPSRRSSPRSGRWSSMASHAVDFWLSTEDLPRPDNRVTARGDDRTRLSYTADNEEPMKRLYEQLKSDAQAHRHARATWCPRHAYLKNDIPVAGVAHQAGTCRFGSDPATSVLNATAAPTSSTTSMWSTRASSRASARSTRRSQRWRTRCVSAITCWSGWGRAERRHDPPGGSRVVIVGGGFAGLGCAKRLAKHRDVTSRCSTATTTTSSSRCCTRWRPLSSPRERLPSPCARCSATAPTSR